MRGSRVLRFDFTGLGASGGEFANSNFSSNVEDLRRAAHYLASHFGPAEILIGHSLGGTAVLAAAADLPDVQAVVTIGAPADTEHVISHFSTHVPPSKAEARPRWNSPDDASPFAGSFLTTCAGSILRRRSADLPAASGSPCPPRRDRRDRQREADLRGRPAPEELHLARRRRPSPDPPRGCRLRRGDRECVDRRYAPVCRARANRLPVTMESSSAHRREGGSNRSSMPGGTGFSPTSLRVMAGLDSGPSPYDSWRWLSAPARP